MGLQAGSKAGKADVEGFVTAIYFCLVTALSIGYGAEVRALRRGEFARQASDGTYTVTYSGEALKLLKATAPVFFHFRN